MTKKVYAALLSCMTDEQLLAEMRKPVAFTPKLNRAAVILAELKRRGMAS